MSDNAKRSIGLTKTIIISSVIITAVILIITAVVGFAVSYTKVKEGVTDTSKQALTVYAGQVDDWLKLQADFAQSQANAAGNLVVSTGDRAHNDDFIDSVMLLNDALLDCYTAYEDTALYMAVTDVTTLPEGFDPTTRSWYRDAARHKRPIYTAPYIDTATGAMIITVAAPIYENGDLAGVFGCDITLDYIMKLVGDMKITENGYPVLIDSEGNFMIHENQSFTPQISGNDAVITACGNVDGDYGQVLTGLTSAVYFDINRDYDGKDKYFAFSSLPSTDWTIGYIMPKSDVNGSLTGLAVTYVVLLAASLAISTAIMIAVTKVQLRPLVRINDTAKKIAAGELSADFNYSASDEIGILCDNFAMCTETTKKYISDISEKLMRLADGDFTVQVNEEYMGDYAPIKESLINIINSMKNTIFNIGETSDLVNTGAAEIASSSSALAAGVMSQTDSLGKLNEEMEQIIKTINESDELAMSARDLASGANDKLKVSKEEMDNLLDAMSKISHMSDETEKIIKTIDDIAFQTNILALNASVEAARAGAAGKGFAVVADEVRNLAGKSAEAASKTAELIGNTRKAVVSGAGLADSTAKSLMSAVENTEMVSRKIELISGMSHTQNTYIQDIFGNIRSISESVNNTSRSVSSDADASRILSGQAEKLSKMLEEFKL